MHGKTSEQAIAVLDWNEYIGLVYTIYILKATT